MSRAHLTGSLKELREQYRASGTFHSPPELVDFIRSLIPGDPNEVYDPTCGTGALLSAFPGSTRKYGQDINEHAVAIAAEDLENFQGASGDVLTDPAWPDKQFSAIVANPPFSVKWQPREDPRWGDAPTIPTKGRADFAFLLHILSALAPDGVAAVLQAPGVCYRGGRESTLRRWMVESLNVVDAVIAIPGDTFTDTSIPTVCLVLQKGRAAAQSLLFEDREHDISRDVTVSEIASNDFCLSPSRYLSLPGDEPEAQPVDVLELETRARAAALESVEKSIDLAAVFGGMGGLDVAPFLDDIEKLVARKRLQYAGGKDALEAAGVAGGLDDA